MVDRAGRTVVADIAFEQLLPGPSGRLIDVVDYDATNDQLYGPIDLDNPGLLVAGGLTPDESDPRFHQQMVYAVSMRVLESFERALGRPFRWRGDRKLRIYPHAFRQRNAYFDPTLGETGWSAGDASPGGALAFGYFEADAEDPGENIPGQTIYTCLTHEIVAHETTHAVLHRLRPHYMTPTSEDVRSFHEGFSDIVALLVPFTYHDVIAEEVARARGRLADGGPLLNLAEQFGFGKGDKKALRTAMEKPQRTGYQDASGAHDRGQVLAAAVMAGFLRAYEREAGATIRLATAGRGLPGRGELHPDLVTEVTRAATKSAGRILNMCIRAIDYLPPVDVTFGDYLRAVVTADADLFPADDRGIRAGLIEGFRERGIYPTGVVSLAERSIQMERVRPGTFSENLPVSDEFITDLAREFDRRADLRHFTVAERRKRLPGSEDVEAATDRAEVTATTMEESASPRVAGRYASQLHRWAGRHRVELGLDPDLPIKVEGFHASQRVAEDGYSRTIVSVQFTQTAPETADAAEQLGGIRIRGGTTVVADSEGTVRYVIRKEVPTRASGGLARLHRFVADLEHENPELAWDADPKRIVKYLSLRRIDDARF
jgi:hypothetical protein